MSETDVNVRARMMLEGAAMPILVASLLLLQMVEASAQDPGPLDKNVTATHLPVLDGPSMDVALVDVDDDCDLDTVIAVEFEHNRLLINDGRGIFSDQPVERLPVRPGTTQDLEIADIDGDGAVDLYLASRFTLDRLLFATAGSACAVQPCPRLKPHRPGRRASPG